MPRRNKADAVLNRRSEVSRLYCQGFSQAKIGQRLGVTQQQISLDLAAIREEWQTVMVSSFDRIKAEQLAKVDAVESQAWRGWYRSLKDSERKTVKEKDTDDGRLTETSESTEGQAGDPRFLQIVDSCIDRRMKIIGGYPDGADESPKSQEVVIRVHGPGMSMAELHGGTVLNARNALPSSS